MTAARRGPPPRATDSSVRLFSNGRIACWKRAAEPWLPRILEKAIRGLNKARSAKPRGATKCVGRVAERVWVCVVHLDREGRGWIGTAGCVRERGWSKLFSVTFSSHV